MKFMNNLLYSMLDCTYPIPGPQQHQLIRSFAKDSGYSVGFYGAEDPDFCVDSPYLRKKSETISQKYCGIIFFSLFQLQGDAESLITELVYRNFVVLFALQKTLIRDKKGLKDGRYLLKSSIQSFKNRKDMEHFITLNSSFSRSEPVHRCQGL